MKQFNDDKPIIRYTLIILGFIMAWLLGAVSFGLLASYIYKIVIKG